MKTMMKYLILFCLFGMTLGFGQASQAQNRKILVCIDPGHGGKDPGKERGTKRLKHESDLNLAIAKKLGNYLETKLDGVDVMYTRTEDKTVSLDDRVIMANKRKADYFISIHCNSNPNKNVYGTKTHIHSHKFAASKMLALRIEKEFRTRGGRKSRGVVSARDRGHNLFVLQYTDMPAVLVEAGFMSNKNEEVYLNSTRGQDLIASAIFRSFRDYLSQKHPLGNRDKVYKVQLMASKKPMKVASKKLNALGLRVVEHSSSSSYAYKYMVGREYDKAGANKLLKEVQEAGFKDAFIVVMSNVESKKFRIVETK